MANGTQFEIGLGVTGAAGVESAADAVLTLAKRLEAAQTAADAAAKLVSAQQAAYNAAETAADRAAKAVERNSLALDAQRTKMAQAMQANDPTAFWRAASAADALAQEQGKLAAKADAAKAALARESAILTDLQKREAGTKQVVQALEKQQEHVQDLAKAEAAQKKSMAEATEKTNGAAEALGKLGGPVGMAGQRVLQTAGSVMKLTKALGVVGPFVALAVAAIAVAAGFVVATAAITKFGVMQADAARTSRLISDGLAGSVEGGRALDLTFAKLSRTVPFTRDELAQMADDLKKTGVQGDQLATELETAAIKAAKLKWGPDFAKQMLSLDVQSRRLKDNFTRLTSGLNIEKLLESFTKLVDLFDSGNSSGRAMQVVFESLFQPVVDGATELVPKMRSAFLQMEILALKALIAIKPYGSQILMVGEALAGLAAIVVGVFAGALAIGFGISAAFWSLLIKMSEASNAAWAAITNLARTIVDSLGKIDLGEIGMQIVKGLAMGIAGAGPAVVAALGDVVSNAIGSAKKLLKIASPSKVFEEIGGYTGEGFAQGVEGTTSTTQSALEGMVAPPAPAAVATGASSGGGGGLNLSGATFNFYGVEGAEDAEGRFGELLTRLLEGDAAQLATARAG